MKYQFITLTTDLELCEMESACIENTKTINMLSKEVTSLKKIVNQKENANNSVESSNISTETLEEFDEEENLISEIEFYYLNIKELENLDENELSQKLKSVLPSVKNTNYQMIIYGINSLIIKEINEMRFFVETEKDNLTKEELKQFKDEIIKMQKLIYLINDAKNIKDETVENDTQEQHLNNLVFMETSSGNIYAVEDLDEKKIPKEYHEGFYELFKSIQDGTFKNVRFLNSTNREVAGIAEVKAFKKRIIFDRINHDTYAIIAVLPKKSDKDKGYMDKLKNRIAIYRVREKSIKEKVKDENYIKEHQEILETIFQMLKSNETEKQKEKGLK